MVKFIVELDNKACQGYRACVELCTWFFQLSEVDGESRVEGAKKVIKENEVDAETLELDKLKCAREASEACHYGAPHIVNVETWEKLI